ncbi:MAG: Fe-S cluster assembly protein SufD, partial [Chloroflexota bacterium]
VDTPFHTIVLMDGEGATQVHRSLIVAEFYGNVNFIEEVASNNDEELGLNVGVVEVVAEEGAQVRYVDVQQLGNKVYNFNTKRSLGGEDSNVVWDLGQFGSALTKTFIDSQLIGDGSNMECNGVYFLDGKQHIDIDTLMQHIGYATGGDLLIHGALKDKARSVFIGMIKIDPTGQLTNSYLKNQNLILDKTARADSIPSLEIDANDVRASHAATISKIEEEYIFYLQSRGVPYDTAVQMIVEGFFSTIFDRMGNDRVKEKLMLTVIRKMTGEEPSIESLEAAF